MNVQRRVLALARARGATGSGRGRGAAPRGPRGTRRSAGRRSASVEALALHPAREREREPRVRDLGAVLGAQAVLDDLELQLADGAEDGIALHALRTGKSWTVPSWASCSRPFLSCFRFSGSSMTTRAKCSGAKRGMPSNSIAAPSASVSPIRRCPGRRRRGCRPRRPPRRACAPARGTACGLASLSVLPGAHVRHLHAALEPPRADAHERDAVAVRAIHVRLDLEDEAREARRGRARRRPSASRAAAAAGASSKKRLEERLEAEVVDRRCRRTSA